MNLQDIQGEFRTKAKAVDYNHATGMWFAVYQGKRISGLEWKEYDEAEREARKYIIKHNMGNL